MNAVRATSRAATVLAVIQNEYVDSTGKAVELTPEERLATLEIAKAALAQEAAA